MFCLEAENSDSAINCKYNAELINLSILDSYIISKLFTLELPFLCFTIERETKLTLPLLAVLQNETFIHER